LLALAVPGGAYLGGLGTIVLALLSPVETLAEISFTAHMIQHQLLQMVAAPLLLLAEPFPIVLWGLPRRARLGAGAWLLPGSGTRAALRLLTWMPVAGVLYTATLGGWHLPAAYGAALTHPWLHDLQHLTFFATAILFWWPVVNPAPRLRRLRSGLQYGLRIGYLIVATALTTLLGAVLALSERVLYPAYAALPDLLGWSPLDDQAFGGGIMWSGAHMYLVAILLLLSRALGSGEPPGENPRARARPIV
jgi:cytochrome c oxidase assembly factor CtaG